VYKITKTVPSFLYWTKEVDVYDTTSVASIPLFMWGRDISLYNFYKNNVKYIIPKDIKSVDDLSSWLESGGKPIEMQTLWQ